MNYFCSTHMQSGRNEEKTIFIVLPEPKQADAPQLKKEILLANNQYKEFTMKYHPKLVLVDYTVYATEAEIYASSQDEVFEKLILDPDTKRIAQSELSINCGKDKGSIRKKRTASSPVTKVVIGSGLMIACLITFGIGNLLGKRNALPNEAADPADSAFTNVDGMIIPSQLNLNDSASDTEQITVSIDRSYSAVPTEDLQLKGTVEDGTAKIALPEFDKNDFFTHVFGYTWGFTTDPKGTKIEYYGGRTYDFNADTKLYRVLVKYGGGSGTKEDPYLIDYYDQLELMGEEQARGYFKQTADIVFPQWAQHQPINTVNELKADPDSEYFEYDGNGFSISAITAPLFGKVSGAVIKNVNITQSVIASAEYKNYGFIVCEAYNYRYRSNGQTYETGETLIQHCSVSHASIEIHLPKNEDENAVSTEEVTAPPVVPPDLIEYDEDGNIITGSIEKPEETKHAEHAIGGITGLGGQIENCYVTNLKLSADLDMYFLYAGGISGKPANINDSVVYSFSVSGTIFTAGGISGSASGARMYDPTGEVLPECYGGSIQGCAARNITLYTEMAAGGIAGESSTDATHAVISNCYANDLHLDTGVYQDDNRSELIKAGINGGIIGMDGKANHGHLILNSVSPTNFYVIGSKKQSSYDDSVRIAPDYAFYQENILTVINKNSLHPDNPKKIYTGSFVFGTSEIFGDENGRLSYPEGIADLLEKTDTSEE